MTKLINGKDYLNNNKDKLQSYMEIRLKHFNENDIEGVISQVSNENPPCDPPRDMGDNMSIIQRLIYMAQNENHYGSTFNYIAQGLLEEAGVKGK